MPLYLSWWTSRPGTCITQWGIERPAGTVTAIVSIGRANLGSPALPCPLPSNFPGARTPPLPLHFHAASMTSSVQGPGQTSQAPFQVRPSASPAAQPCLALPCPALRGVAASQLAYRVAVRRPEIAHVLHNNAGRFGKLSRLLAVPSTAYKSALMEIPEPMMARSCPRGRGRQLSGDRTRLPEV